MVKVKVCYNNDIRLWRYPLSRRYDSLVDFVEKNFHLVDGSFNLQYEDEEGDKITFSNESDLEYVLDSAGEDQRKSLKLYVSKKVHKQNNNTTALPSQTEKPLDFNFGSSNNRNNGCNAENETMDFVYSRDLILQFVQDPKIRSLLPDLVRDIMNKLRQNNSLEKSLKDVLQEEKYKPIQSSKLYSQIEKKLSRCLQRAQHYVPILLSFSEDVVVSFIPKIIDVFTNGLFKVFNLGTELNTDPVFQAFASNMKKECDENYEYKDEQTVHNNVQCDGCDIVPICGIRYKCGVCSNFDMCSNCEANKKHDPTHPLVKITRPLSGARGGFLGLNEILGCRARGRYHCGRYQFYPHPASGHHNSHSMDNINTQSPLQSQADEKAVNSDADSNTNISNSMPKSPKKCQNKKHCSKKWSAEFAKSTVDANNPDYIERKNKKLQAKLKKLQERLEQTDSKINDISQQESNPSELENSVKEEVQVELKPESINNVIQNEKHNKQQVLCICGSSLVATTPAYAYKSYDIRVNCDICAKYVGINNEVYHCPELSMFHPDGYDMCSDCVKAQIKIEEPILKIEEPILKIEEPILKIEEPILKIEEPILKIEEPKLKIEEPILKIEEPIIKQEEPIINIQESVIINDLPVMPSIDNNNNNNNRNNNNNNVWGRKFIDTFKNFVNSNFDIIDNKPEESKKPFLYQNEYEILIGMGLNDEKRLKEVLLKHGGNVERSLDELFN